MKWPMVRLAEFCKTSSGGTPSRKVAEYYDGDIPWVKSGDLRESIVTEVSEHITPLAIEKSSAKIVPSGAILLAMYGATVGRMAWLGIDAATNQAVCSIIPDESKAFPKYVYYALLSKVPHFLKEAVGGAQPNISQGLIRETEIPLPPLAEQQRIAAILDKADAIRRKRQQAIQLADEFLRAVFLDMFGDPVTNPKGWEVKTLTDLIRDDSIITYGIVQAGPHLETGIPYIRTGDFKNGKLAKDGYAKTSPEIASKFKRSEVKAGDLVYCIRASIGSVDIVPDFLDGANLTQGTAKISPASDVLADYLVEFLRSSGFKTWIDQNSKGATFKEITLGKLREAPVYHPPLDIQKTFVEIKRSIEANMNKFNDWQELPLFNSLSQKAFKGEL